MNVCRRFIWAFVALASTLASRGLAAEFDLADGGNARVAIYAPGENQWAGKRLADRLLKFTGARVEVHVGDRPPGAPPAMVVVGTLQNNPVVKSVLQGDPRIGGLGEEGYLLRTARWGDRPVLVAAGNTLAGANHAVSELVSWKLKLRDGGASVAGELNLSDKPALKYRIVWTWDGNCNWASSVEETMALYVNENPATGSMAVPYTPEGFRTHFTRAIDYFSDHKLGGLIVWGFLRDEHGGVEMGREISRYARRNNVRILPGVCSQGAYGGFIFSRSHKFNLDVWCREHPELRATNAKGEFVAGMIDPSKPENLRWLRDGATWLFSNLPDIGGINLENGDFFSCHCSQCRLERSKPENDPNCLWDMMVTQKPILEVAQKMQPDGWMTFATYVGFTERAAKSAGKSSVYPPKFVKQTPANAICQWTVTGMTAPGAWPEDARPPASNFRGQIGMLHHGSVWGTPVDPARWWTSPGAWNDEYSTLLRFVCDRAVQSKLDGLVITGQNGNHCPAHELNYLALEYFGWHPERTYQQFFDDRLVPCYGGAERAELFLKLLRNTSQAPAELEAMRLQAQQTAGAKDLDIRQRARWKDLAGELARRCKLAKSAGKTAK